MPISMELKAAALKPVSLIVTPRVTKKTNPPAKIAGRIYREQLQRRPESVLGFAAGDSVKGLYQDLVFQHRRREIDFSLVTTFNLDEYLGLEQNTYSHTFLYFMLNHLFNPLGLLPEQVNFLDSFTKDPAKICEQYEESIWLAGGIDLQLLGLGVNGHVAFNEPGSSINSVTRVVDLSLETRLSNSRFFMHKIDRRIFWLKEGQDPSASARHWTLGQREYFEKKVLPRVPRRAMTMGIKTILQARKLLMLVNGRAKAKALSLALLKEPTPDIPASLMRYHPDFTIIADLEAAALLPKPWNAVGEYYIGAGQDEN